MTNNILLRNANSFDLSYYQSPLLLIRCLKFYECLINWTNLILHFYEGLLRLFQVDLLLPTLHLKFHIFQASLQRLIKLNFYRHILLYSIAILHIHCTLVYIYIYPGRIVGNTVYQDIKYYPLSTLLISHISSNRHIPSD